MIKKIFGITTLLFLSVFLIIPVQASAFTKTIGIEPDTLDYKNSLIDWYGYNTDIDLIKDIGSGIDAPYYTLRVFVDNVRVIDKDPVTWQLVEGTLYKAILSSSEKQIIKTIIFGRQINNNNFIQFLPRSITTSNIYGSYFKIEFKSLMNINFASVYMADAYDQSNVGLLSSFVKSITLLDQQDAVIYSSGQLDDNTTQTLGFANKQKALYNFNNVYTGVKSIYIGYQLTANNYAPPTLLAYYIWSIGLFADSQVILPDIDIETDFQIYQPTICGILDLACVSRNLIGELSNTLYNHLGADNIASSILNIYDTLFYPVYIIDNTAWQNAILAIYLMFPIGIIILIIKRVT